MMLHWRCSRPPSGCCRFRTTTGAFGARSHPRSSTRRSATAASAELQEALQGLMEGGMEEEALQQRIVSLEQLAAGLGVNRVDAALNDGSFHAKPLSGRLAKVTSAPSLTLGALTFMAAQPADLKLGFRMVTAPSIFKGMRAGVPNAYTVTSGFSTAEPQLPGLCEVAGTYRLDEQNPQRLHVEFTEVVLRLDRDPQLPAEEQAELLRQWQQLLGEANPGCMDPATGTLLVPLAKPASAWLDYLVMTEGWQVTRSSMGSVAMLQTAGG